MSDAAAAPTDLQRFVVSKGQYLPAAPGARDTGWVSYGRHIQASPPHRRTSGLPRCGAEAGRTLALFCFMCMDVLPASLSLCHTCLMPLESVRSPESEVVDNCVPPCGC